MSGSILSCSGAHWFRLACSWGAVAFAFSILIDLPAGPEDTETARVQTPAVIRASARHEIVRPVLAVATTGSRVVVDMKALNLEHLNAAAFGDTDE